MKASKAFYKTLKHIMNGVNTIFSLGFNNYPNNDLLIPFVETAYKPAVTVKSNIVKNKFEQSIFLNKKSNLETKVYLKLNMPNFLLPQK